MRKPRTLALVVTTAALAAVFAMFFAPDLTQAIGARDAQKGAVPPGAAATPRQIEANRIVPADVLGTGVVQWAPLTGDGSN